MHKYIPLILLASCSIDTIEIPVQINPYVCVDGFQWTLDNEPIVDETGNQLTCQ